VRPSRRPPATILEFLERVGVQLALDRRGEVTELYTREALPLAPYVREALPVIKAELQRRAQLARRPTKPGVLPPAGPRLGQVRVTNLFRGMNLVEAFVGQAEWIELAWSRRQRDGKKVAAQKLLALQTADSDDEER